MIENDKNHIRARIIAEYKESYVLKSEISEFSAKITGKMMFTASTREDYPAVGDWVLTTPIWSRSRITWKIKLPRNSLTARFMFR